MSSSDTQTLLDAYRDLRRDAQERAEYIERSGEAHWRERRERQRQHVRDADKRITELMARLEEEGRREQSTRDACLLGMRGLC